MTPLPVEARPYGPDSTPEEIAALKSRIYLYAPDIILWQEVPVMTVFQVEKFAEKVDELRRGLTSFRYLIDLREAPLPAPEVRAKLVSVFKDDAKLRDLAVFTGKNFLVNIACKFVFTAAGLRGFTIHKTLEQALAALNHGAK
jgi:hypothetical protein